MNNSKKAIIYVFSGTGNTYIAAKKVAESLSAKNIHTDIYRVRSSANNKNSNLSSYGFISSFENIPNPNDYDIALFAYPIYAFNTPSFFRRFVKGLKSINGDMKIPAYIFKTSGEPFRPNSASSYSLVKILKKKGFLPCSDVHMLMPYNIIFRYPDPMVKQMYIHTESMAEILAENIASNNTKNIPKYSLFWIIISYILRLQQFGALINGPLYRINYNICTNCGKCINLCPSDNIKLIEKTFKDKNGNELKKNIPKVGNKCQMCMACTINCPTNSINPGIITPFKVNPAYDFTRILNDESIPSNWTDSPNAGYFKMFRKYYKRNPLIQDSQYKE